MNVHVYFGKEAPDVPPHQITIRDVEDVQVMEEGKYLMVHSRPHGVGVNDCFPLSSILYWREVG